MSKKSNTSKRYTAEFKRDAVALVHSSGKTVTEVARDIGVSAEGTIDVPGKATAFFANHKTK
ncbi:transposase [Streptomyces sp. NPDC006544]|uniref:transposase n=1 Tax=Streptomyces sp. NPDC006544 TaxID=3154583 RepID=UPI0033BD6B5E